MEVSRMESETRDGVGLDRVEKIAVRIGARGDRTILFSSCSPRGHVGDRLVRCNSRKTIEAVTRRCHG